MIFILEKEAKKEIERIEKIIQNIKLIKKEGLEILKLIEAYHTDAKQFYKDKKFLQAFEAAVICWTYADAGLHLKVFEIPENLKSMFTV